MRIETMKTMNWEKRPQEQIIQDLLYFINKVKKFSKYDKLKPFWSTVKLESEEELERLNTVRGNIQMFYDRPIGPVYFIGYTTEKADRWYLSYLNTVLEIKRPEIFEFNFECKIEWRGNL